jgi:hypothetical protein
MFFDNIVDFDRPILIKGKELKIKISVRITEVQEEIDRINDNLIRNYAQCLEGSLKSRQKREILQNLSIIEDRKMSLEKTLSIIKNRKNYALTINEASDLKII